VKPAVADPLTALRELGGPQLTARLEACEARLTAIAQSSPHASSTITAGGKRLRPMLVFLAGMEADDEEALVRAGAAVELVHAATLVHDDVLDDAPLRRGQATVYASAGRAAAMQTGDVLFAAAFAELAQSDSPAQLEALSRASSALARGELLQREDAWRADVSVERYLLRCELKTGRLFEAACELGSLVAGGPSLARFGRDIGVAFQILDDVLDVSGPAERTGKQRGTDLLDGTVTLPLILALERGLEPFDLRTIDDPGALCDRIGATGALDEARTTALELVADAKQALPSVSDRQRTALELIADSVVLRYS
jgi:geranylgeranyl pyrophosphate synthase